MAAPTAAFTVIPVADVDPDSPLTSGLMDSLRLNDQNLVAQLVGDPVSSPTFTPAAEHNHDGVNSKIVSGPSQALQLIELKELSAAASTVTFSTSIAAETDEALMRLIGRIKKTSGINPMTLTLEPNGLTASQSSTVRRLNATGSVAAFGATAGLILFDDPSGSGAGDYNYFTCDMWMRRTVQSVAGKRAMLSKAMVTTGVATPELQECAGLWADVATAVTSLNIVSTTVGGQSMAAGSSLALYRVRIS